MNENLAVIAYNKNDTPIGETNYVNNERTDFFYQDNETIDSVEINGSLVSVWLCEHFANVPCPRRADSVSYYGGMARFIWNNLPGESFC